MAWPTHGDVSPQYLDESTDSPQLARNAIHDTTVMANRMKNERGTPSGVCDLDSNALVPVSRLPVVPVNSGGTGGTTKAEARAGLSLGTIAVRNAGGANGAATLNANGELAQRLTGFAAAAQGTVPVKSGAGHSWQVFNSEPPTNSVGQAQLKDAVGEVFGLVASGSPRATLVLPGGQFGFYPQTRHLAASGSQLFSWQLGNYGAGFGNDSYATRVSIVYVSGVSGTGYVQQRYFTASPPYDLGDGPTASFFFLDLDAEGKAVAGYMAQDPPWVYSGPTDCRPRRVCPKTGKAYAHECCVPGEAAELLGKLDDPGARAALLHVLRGTHHTEVEITQARKAADMAKVPTPFSDPRGTPVLLDPVGDAVRDLEDIRTTGEDVSTILDRYIKIHQDPLRRAGPPGIPVVGATWRNTRQA